MPGPQPCHYHPCILCIVGRGLDPSAGRRGRRPLQHNPQGFSLPQTSAATWGQAALHPTLPYSVGRAFARNSFTPPCRGRACPARSLAITTPFILCIVGRGLDPSAGRRGRRPLQICRKPSGCLQGRDSSFPSPSPPPSSKISLAKSPFPRYNTLKVKGSKGRAPAARRIASSPRVACRPGAYCEH